ncbi:MAG TPA: DUF3891 family protein [Thermoanaerobaculia bacterium]|nr:DUF3891 family protein [Thermoanaerobaculia bacterium]
MIVFEEGAKLRLVTQPDHAFLAGEILSLWRADGLPENPRRGEIVFAGREHDNGWREADAAPRCDLPSGRPVDFHGMPNREPIEIWERGISRFKEQHPYAALLIARHARQLHRGRAAPAGSGPWSEFLRHIEEVERELAEQLGVSGAAVAADYRFIDLADQVSLAACGGWSEPFERWGRRGRLQGWSVILDPLPLAGATTFRVACRRIPRRAYRGDADLGGELAAARWDELIVRLAGDD